MAKPSKSAVAVAIILLLGYIPALAASRDMVQLQTQVQTLQESIARMQQSFDERMGVMKNLIEQSTDNINRMTAAVDALQKSVQQQNSESASRNDQVSGQIQALHDSLDELKARVAKMSKQMDDMNAPKQDLAPDAGSGQPQAQAPPADVLYNNGLRDYNAAKFQLAAQEFSDYLKFYGTTDLAGNAQFYLGELNYRQGQYPEAIKAYDAVLEQYPGGNKTPAAQLKKGYALLNMGERDAGVRELHSLIARYPKSPEAAQARDRIKRLVSESSGRRAPASQSDRE